ncbi:MAG: glycosyltransferase [Catenisphaera adipataccumulans]|uniref:glycosyltransferase n=1 Tax=Catenisphaera adipataccumulans TaxID=700500 RepID=UPI003D9229C2
MISVLMSTYREADNILQEAVDSILRQTCRDLEFIILCDDPENTHTQRILENYAKQDGRIRFYINEQNSGADCFLKQGIKTCAR